MLIAVNKQFVNTQIVDYFCFDFAESVSGLLLQMFYYRAFK